MQGTTTLDDVTRAALYAHRAATIATLPVVLGDPQLKAGAVQWLGALEDRLGIERTFPRRDERRAQRVEGQP